MNEIPLEIRATFDGDNRTKGPDAGARAVIHLAALRHGQPVPGAVFKAIDASLTEETIQAGPDGSAAWTPSGPGNYSVYTSHFSKASGTFGGKNYGEIRDFATLAFRWPLAPKEADPTAVALFGEAMAARARWDGFPGFSADIRGKLDGRPFSGTVLLKGHATFSPISGQLKT